MGRTLWVDVTMLVNWSGKMTGIQRVEYNLASRFAQEKDVRFFVFDKSKDRFIDFDFKHIEFKVSSEQSTPESTQTQQAPAQKPPLIKRVLRRLKRELRPLYHVAKQSLSKLMGIPPSGQDQRASINEGDTILVLSGDWSDGSFLDLLSKHKSTKNIQVIQIIYDMLPYLYPSYFVPGMPEQFSNYMKRALSLSDKVLAISKSTKRDVESFAHVNKLKKLKIEVFRLGDDFVLTPPTRPATLPVGVDNNFILTVGTVEARKNHQLILDAYIEAEKRGIDLPTMVIAGKKGWLTEDFFRRLEENPKINEEFIFLQPTDTELAWLYKNCMFTVFPSVYEGWGLPVAESLFNGKMCISSNSSSMPEIAGELIDYFSPDMPNELLDKILYYVNNKKEIQKKEAAISHYTPTSWDASFADVSKIIGFDGQSIK